MNCSDPTSGGNCPMMFHSCQELEADCQFDHKKFRQHLTNTIIQKTHLQLWNRFMRLLNMGAE